MVVRYPKGNQQSCKKFILSVMHLGKHIASKHIVKTRIRLYLTSILQKAGF